jgi:hypothetical protein
MQGTAMQPNSLENANDLSFEIACHASGRQASWFPSHHLFKNILRG